MMSTTPPPPGNNKRYHLFRRRINGLGTLTTPVSTHDSKEEALLARDEAQVFKGEELVVEEIPAPLED